MCYSCYVFLPWNIVIKIIFLPLSYQWSNNKHLFYLDDRLVLINLLIIRQTNLYDSKITINAFEYSLDIHIIWIYVGSIVLAPGIRWFQFDTVHQKSVKVVDYILLFCFSENKLYSTNIYNNFTTAVARDSCGKW